MPKSLTIHIKRPPFEKTLMTESNMQEQIRYKHEKNIRLNAKPSIGYRLFCRR